MHRFAIAIAAPILAMVFIGARHAEAAAPSCGVDSGHVGMVVEHADGSILQFCVGISGTSASGQTVLSNSGVQYSTVTYGGSLGAAVCQIDHEPQSYPPGCFQSGSPYWEIFAARGGGAWTASQSGISGLQLNSGDTLGFRYETGSSPPPQLSIACPPPPSASPAPAVARPTATGSLRLQAQQTASSITHPALTSTGGATSPTPTDEILALHASRSLTTPAAPSPGPSWGLLFAFLCVGAMIGLLVLQFVRRR